MIKQKCENCGNEITSKTTYCKCGAENNNRELINEETDLNKKQKIAMIVGFLLFALIVFTHICWAKASDDPTNFQRGGALIVIVEFSLFSWVRFFDNQIQSQAWVGGRPVSKFEKLSFLFAVVLGVIGTFIWGYGDLIFEVLFL